MQQTIDRIISILETFRMKPGPNDLFNAKGKQIMSEKMATFMANNEPIKFSMLGFPFKSMNTRDKVLGKKPDLGEQLSLCNYNDFARKVQAVYAPGIRYSFISDGYAFSDIYGTSESEVAMYGEITRDMAKSYPIDWYDMKSFYPAHLSLLEMREEVIRQYGITQQELEFRILTDPNTNYLYTGMIHFMQTDLSILPFPSKSQLQKRAKILAREMMFRNEAYSELIRQNFADHIRLSMHQSVNDGVKYSFQMIPGHYTPIHSPWHAAVVQHKDGTFQTMHKKDALEAGHELVNINGQPFYFQEL